MNMRQTDLLSADENGIDRAARLLRDGDLVAFPTETVYGLGADAGNDLAVAKVFAAKGRPQFNPLIVHVASLDQARKIAIFNETAERLAQAFWPGALTLVLPLNPTAGIAPLVSAGLPTIALRLPDHPLAQSLLNITGPIAAPSANISGKISPTTAGHVLNGLDGKIAGVLDGGPCPVGLESTIIGFDPTATLLRPGGLPSEVIEACLGSPLALQDTNAHITSPGQLASHYAPSASLRLNAKTARPGEVLLGFGPIQGNLNLSKTGDLVEAAATLFQHLHTLDQTKKTIAVAPIPDHGLGRAINDRLHRAAAPR